jgi:hypothetical protein
VKGEKMYLVNLYGNYRIEGAIEYAFFGENTILLIRDRFLIPTEIRRWETGDWTEGFGAIRIGHEGSRFTIKRNRDGTYTVAYYPPGWQPVRFTGTLAECADWYNNNDWKLFNS